MLAARHGPRELDGRGDARLSIDLQPVEVQIDLRVERWYHLKRRANADRAGDQLQRVMARQLEGTGKRDPQHGAARANRHVDGAAVQRKVHVARVERRDEHYDEVWAG